MSQRLRLDSILVSIILSLLLTACRQKGPEPSPARDTVARSAETTSVHAPLDTQAATTPIDTLPHAVTGAAPQLTRQTRAELVSDVGRFIAVIDSGDQETFWKMLAQRSRRQIDRGELAPKEEVWSAARQTLGDIQSRRISIIGGTQDSVALLVEGLRNIDSERIADPVIIHLLREDGSWKVMYPGLLYPMHHLRR
jgi:hypothetical protein